MSEDKERRWRQEAEYREAQLKEQVATLRAEIANLSSKNAELVKTAEEQAEQLQASHAAEVAAEQRAATAEAKNKALEFEVSELKERVEGVRRFADEAWKQRVAAADQERDAARAAWRTAEAKAQAMEEQSVRLYEEQVTLTRYAQATEAKAQTAERKVEELREGERALAKRRGQDRMARVTAERKLRDAEAALATAREWLTKISGRVPTEVIRMELGAILSPPVAGSAAEGAKPERDDRCGMCGAGHVFFGACRCAANGSERREGKCANPYHAPVCFGGAGDCYSVSQPTPPPKCAHCGEGHDVSVCPENLDAPPPNQGELEARHEVTRELASRASGILALLRSLSEQSASKDQLREIVELAYPTEGSMFGVLLHILLSAGKVTETADAIRAI